MCPGAGEGPSIGMRRKVWHGPFLPYWSKRRFHNFVSCEITVVAGYSLNTYNFTLLVLLSTDMKHNIVFPSWWMDDCLFPNGLLEWVV